MRLSINMERNQKDMPKILILEGLPASGKSTFARGLSDKGWVRVNKDDLRSMLHNGHWSKANEQFILEVRDSIITFGMLHGFNIVVDDTNLHPKHIETITKIVEMNNEAVLPHPPLYTIEEKFFDTPLEECIRRDLTRQNSVGEAVIRKMYNQFITPKPVKYVPPKGKPRAIISDIDGTLAHMQKISGINRSPYEWGRVGEDTRDDAVYDILNTYANTDEGAHRTRIIIVSGRDSVCRPETEDWLKRQGVQYDELFMRPEGDNRKDTLIKQEIFENHIRENYQVMFVLDDRKQVIRMWQRELGLKVLCCANDIDEDF
jgi:predicted kinase